MQEIPLESSTCLMNSLGGSRYFMSLIDDYSRKCWLYFLTSKSETLDVFKQWKSHVENETGMKVKTLRTDRGGEFMSNEFDLLCNESGMFHQLTTAYSPQQNGVAERKNRTVVEGARCMLKDSGLGRKFWAEAVHTAMYLQNRSPTKALDGMTPEEVYYGKKPNVSHLRVFGCLAYAHVHKQNRQKLDDKSIKCIFIGYATCSKAYKLYDPVSQNVIITRDVMFDETKNSADFHLVEEDEDPLIFFEVDEETGGMKDEGFKAVQNRPAGTHEGIH